MGRDGTLQLDTRMLNLINYDNTRLCCVRARALIMISLCYSATYTCLFYLYFRPARRVTFPARRPEVSRIYAVFEVFQVTTLFRNYLITWKI